jgi:hypothetical protein
VCCFCGGGALATTRDHVPAKALFDGKHRPNALVLPSCEQCQKLSKPHELVAAMVARMLPDPSTRALKKEVKKYLTRAGRAVPGLLQEMRATSEQEAKFAEIRHLEPRAAGVLNHSGPLLNKSMELFGVKLTCALFYEHTRRIITPEEAISARVYTNVDAVQGKLPGEALNIMGEPETLEQGKWSVPNQFWYQYAIDPSKAPAGFFSAFRRSFAILGIVWGHASNVPPGDGIPTYSPSTVGGFNRIR